MPKIVKREILLLIQACALIVSAEKQCLKQGPFQLVDRPLLPRASKDLTVCQQYSQCTCCNRSVSLHILRGSAYWLYDSSLSAECRDGLLSIVCSDCDPDVGTGVSRGICESTCRDVAVACSNDFFGFSFNGKLSPCSQDPQSTVICSRLKDIGGSLCQQMGYEVSTEQACFDGSSPSLYSSCKQSLEPEASKTWSKELSWLAIFAMLCIVGAIGLALTASQKAFKRKGTPKFRGRSYTVQAPSSRIIPRRNVLEG